MGLNQGIRAHDNAAESPSAEDNSFLRLLVSSKLVSLSVEIDFPFVSG
jgi:hypothetical protein